MTVGGVTLPAQGVGTTQPDVAVDQIAGREYQLVKLVDGTVDGTGPVSASLPLDSGDGKVGLWVNNQLMLYDHAAGKWSRARGTAANGLLVDVTRVTGTVTTTGTVTVSTLPVLPAGDNNIGNVDVVSLPSLPAGNANIGDVDVASLPSLPAGANAIGTVGVTSLPTLPAGNNNIGDVDVATLPSLPAGNNNIGDVDVATLPALPTGTNSIGRLGANDGVDIGDVTVNNAVGNPVPVNVVAGGGGGSSPTALAAVAHTVAAATTSSTTVLAANASRRYALIENISDENVFLKINAAAVNNQGIQINGGGGAYEMSLQYGNLSTAAIHAIHAGTGSKTLLITEGT